MLDGDKVTKLTEFLKELGLATGSIRVVSTARKTTVAIVAEVIGK
jgi:hypothetical protein